MEKRLRFKVIACDVLVRELSLIASQTPHYLDIRYLPQGLHNTPDLLREEVMTAIRETEEGGFPYDHMATGEGYDAILLLYGLCSNGLAGVRSLGTPLVIPRAHDCITLMLGSKETYRKLFEQHPGTYWFSPGWIERGWQPSEEKYRFLMTSYAAHYGEENAEYLMDMEQNWIKEYKQALYIAWPEFDGLAWGREETRRAAEFLHWAYREVPGDKGLLSRILGGVFRDDEVLVVHKDERILPSYDANVLTKG
jgi:hypothetical protein